MAEFYGTVQGTRGQATRLGTKKSGMETYCASWKGAVRCHAYMDKNGVQCVKVELTSWQGTGGHKILYDGPFKDKY